MVNYTQCVFLAAFIAGLSAVPLPAVTLSDREQAYIQGKNEIVFAMRPGYAPFSFSSEDQVTGMDVELVRWMATKMGFRAHFEVASLEDALNLSLIHI